MFYWDSGSRHCDVCSIGFASIILPSWQRLPDAAQEYGTPVTGYTINLRLESGRCGEVEDSFTPWAHATTYPPRLRRLSLLEIAEKKVPSLLPCLS